MRRRDYDDLYDKDYYNSESPREKGSDIQSEKIGIVNLLLKIRTSPSSVAPSIGILQRDDSVRIIGDSGEYYKIEIPHNPGRLGYVMKDFVEVQNDGR